MVNYNSFKPHLRIWIMFSLLLTLLFSSVNVEAMEQPYERISGSNRYQTAIEISKEGWPQGSENVIIANGTDWSDALVGASLAYLKDAPILITAPTLLKDYVLLEIKRLGAKNIYILGNHEAVSKEIENQLYEEYYVTRIGGIDRLDTAVQVGEELRKNVSFDTVIIATQENFPDALAVAPFSAINSSPILFTSTDALRADTKQALIDWDITKAIIVGGTGVVSDNVKKEIQDLGILVDRVSGSNRYLTSLEIAKYFDEGSYPGIALATGDNYPDALTGALLAAKKGMPILSVRLNGVRAEVQEYVSSLSPESMLVFGGTGVISDAVVSSLGSYQGTEATETSKTVYEPNEISAIVSPAVAYIEVYDQNNQPFATGSCFIIDSSGKIATNFHVIEGAYSAKVRLIDGRIFDVTNVFAYDAIRDIALLKINGINLPTVTLGDSSKIANGDKVVTIGSPKGLENTISDGLISNKNREMDGQYWIQTSAPISSGSSGGVLVNCYAEVIGVTTLTHMDAQNINLAIPINEVKEFMTENLNLTLADLVEGVVVKTLTWDDGTVYVGETKLDIPHGTGTITFSNGDIYTGDFVDGYRTGQGTYSWFSGDQYEGSWLMGEQEGQGTYAWADGSKYVGEWENGLRHGQGTEYAPDGTVFYSGIWENDQPITATAPTGVWALAISDSQIVLNWDEMPSTEYYYVYYSDSYDGQYIPFQNEDGSKMQLKWFSGYSASLTNMAKNTTAYFKVTAIQNGIESPYSSIVYATTLAESNEYLGLGLTHWISKVIDYGTYIQLNDGSLWEISAYDKYDTMLWMVVDEITVIENTNSFLYPYILVNTSEGETAEAKLISQ